MLQRLAPSAPLHQPAQFIHLRRRQRALEIQIQPHPRQLEDVRQQQLRLQPGRIHTLPGEEFRAALNGFQNGHGISVGCPPAVKAESGCFPNRIFHGLPPVRVPVSLRA